ncbi:leucine rich repeat family protein [Stylonychia lemnae]|uniref:Leucine rich repeat family protein n=1 Tax=Stylonychia lemnae TaxID=5949 RepID=A0A078AB94_STYLE|nr:leucine rich repeat family protein [Stylonychia lemnae]|eukprot:CDW79156.1 leucine rich repeat family protein [Stylonychia lemnae]
MRSQNQAATMEGLIQEFYNVLNSQRVSFKKKPIAKFILGEIIIQELLQNGITKQDQNFVKVMENYQMFKFGNLDYLYYEDTHQPKSYQFSSQVLTHEFLSNFIIQEIYECFNKTLDDMINGPFKVKILTGINSTHISFGATQVGQKGEKFVVAALTSKSSATFDAFINCISSSDSGILIVGKVYDMSKKPAFISVNREQQNQLVIGPNRIMYSQETSEFRAYLPQNYMGRQLSQILQSFDQHNVIEIFLTDIQNAQIQNGEGADISQNFNQFNTFDIGFQDIMPDYEQLEKRQGGLSMLLQSANLLGENDSNSQKQNTRSTTQTAGVPQIRTTRAQQIRQQAALMKQQTQPQIQQQQSNNNMQMNPNFNRNNFQNQNNRQTPQMNRSQSFTIGFNKQNNTSVQTPTFNNNNNNNFRNGSNFNNENQNPNNLTFNNQSKNTFQSNTNNTVGFKPPNNFNNSQNQVQPFKINFNLSSNNNGYNSGNNQFSQSNSSAFQKNPNFQFNSQQTQSFNQVQFKPQSNFNSNYQNNQNQGFKPVFNFNNQSNTNFQNQQQPQQWSNFNNQNRFNNNFSNNNGYQNNQNYNQNSTSNGNQNSYSYQSNFNNFNNQWQQQQQLQQQQQQQAPPKEHLVFSQLSPIDQETLKGYLKNLSQDLNPDQIQKVTALMLTDPVQFFNYYKAAVDQFEKSKNTIQSSKNRDLKQTNFNITQNNDQKPNQNITKLKDYDDLSLFLYTLTDKLQKNDDLKYQLIIKQLRDCQITPTQALKKLVIRNRQPINESFKKLYLNQQHTDLVLSLRGEEFLCHQIVFTSNSEFFKKAIRESETYNKIQFGPDVMIASKLLIPDWIDMSAFKLFVLYMYTGKVGVDGNFQQLSDKDFIELLRIGNFFYNEYLQEFLIAHVIIPQMSPASAVIFIKECTVGSKHHKNSCLNAWAFLKAYSQYYLEKHLHSLIRTNPSLMYELDINLMREIIDQSLLYIVDGSKDLESILQFTADTWAEKSISTLFRRSQESMDSCSAFDYQIVPLMSDFLRTIDVLMDYKCQLIKSQDVITSAIINKSSTSISAETENKKTDLDSTFVQGITADNQGNELRPDLSSWKPSANILKDNITSKDLFESREPQIHQQINLDQIKVDFEKNKGSTIITKAFDFGRRSWHLKIDIDYDKNVSLWIVERGPILDCSPDGVPQVGISIPIKFSSMLIQFEILDAAFGEYKSLIFYTFAHDHNQIIGHQNFINISQLKEKNEINIKVHMREFILHSSLTYYISQNFQSLYQKDLKTLELQKKNYLANKNSFFYNHPNVYNEYELLNMAFYNVFQIFLSQDLKVEDENLVLGFIFHYTKIQSIINNDENMKFISNLLVQTLKFYYISTKKILSALRDNFLLRQSSLFITKTTEEFQMRFQTQNQLLLNINGSSSKSTHVKEQPRKYYDMSRVQNQGRAKQQATAAPDQNKIHPFIQDLVLWLQTSKHSKIDEQTFLNEIRKQVMEDTKKNVNLLRQNTWTVNYQNYNANFNNSPRYDYQRRNHARSYSNDNRQQAYNYNNCDNQYRNQMANIGNQRARTPPKFLQTKQNDLNYKNGGHENKRLNNSYDQGRYANQRNPPAYNDSTKANNNYLQTNGSFHQAESKLRNNLIADYSMLLNNLDQSLQYNKNNQNCYYQTKSTENYNQNNNGYVPYYRQDRRYENNASTKYIRSKDSGADDGCKIF